VSVTVEKALQLIEAMSRSVGPVGVSQLGRELSLNKSTVYRLVDTLVRHGYAQQDATTGRYALTVKLWELGLGAVRGMGLRQTARPVLEREAQRTGRGDAAGHRAGARAADHSTKQDKLDAAVSVVCHAWDGAAEQAVLNQLVAGHA